MACSKCVYIRWGYHRNGTPRWRCKVCKVSKTREKSRRVSTRILEQFLLEGRTCLQLADDLNISASTVRRKIHHLLDQPPSQTVFIPDPEKLYWLITDATHFRRWGALIVTKATTFSLPLAVSFHDKENYQTVKDHLQPLSKLAISGYTSDGKKGIVLAYADVFPKAPQQRGLVHICLKVQTLLTNKPKLIPGRKLLKLVMILPRIRSTAAAVKWWQLFCYFSNIYSQYINKRTYRGRAWGDTHYNLHRAYKHVQLAGDHLFVYLTHELATYHTNKLEGLFGQKKPALSRHRGMSRKRVANAVLWIFYLLHQKLVVS